MSANAVLGTYRAIVVNNNDPRAGARVTLKVPQVLGNAESNWAAPAVPTSIVPAPGDMLWVSFEGGDLSSPVYTPPGLLQLTEAIAGLDGTTFTGSPPKAPSALTLSTASVVTREGATKWVIGVEWTAPTENQDGSVPIKMLTGYRVQYSYDGTQWAGGAFTPETSWLVDNLLTGTHVYVRVQALSNSAGPGLWTTADITTGAQASPDTPSAPTAVGQINGVRVSWDGHNAAAAPMPSQFAYAQIQRAESAAFSAYVEVGSLTAAGDFFDKSAVNGQQYFFRLVAVSKAGDRSAPGASTSATGFADPAIAQAQTTADNAATSISGIQTTLTGVQGQVDGKSSVYVQGTQPHDSNLASDTGDIWIDTANNRIIKTYNGSDWVISDDTRLAVALSTAQSKITTFYAASTATPTATAIGDLWIKTDLNNRLFRASATGTGGWTEVTDTRVAQAATDISSLQSGLATANGRIDGKAVIWVQPTAPTGLVAADQGDIWIDTSTTNRVTKVWDGSAFQDITDQKTLETLATVNNKVTTFYGSSTPTATAVGDLWLDSGNGNVLKRATATGTASWVAVQDTAISGAQGTATQALNTANGKNKVIFSTTTPGATPNSAGDVWFQKTDTDDIIGQWEGAGGTTWVAKAFSHEVISSVTAASISVGLLTGDQIEGNTINAAHLAAVIAVVSKLCSSTTGRRWEADSAGIRVIDSNGATIINFPTDSSSPASFTGDLVASSLTVSDQMAIRGLANEISKGSKLTLSAGTTAPTSPPTVTLDWESVTTNTSASTKVPRNGLVYWQGKFWSTTDNNLTRPTLIAQSYNADGSTSTSFSMAGGSVSISPPTSSLTLHGNALYLLWHSTSDATTVYTVNGYDTTGAQTVSWTYTAGSGDRTPIITSDGTNILIVYTDAANVVKWRTFNPTTGALVASKVSTYAYSGTFDAAVTTSGDLGSQRTFLVTTGGTTALAFDANAARTPNDDFPLPTGAAVRGIAYDGTRFRTYSPGSATGVLYRHASTNWTAASSTWWVSTTWYDNNATGGTHETTQGPRKQFTMLKRARLNVAPPPLPPATIPASTDDVTSARIYAGAGSADPTPAGMQRLGETSATTMSFDAVVLTPVSATPPGTNTFTSGVAAQINSSDGSTVLLKGNGDATVGGLTVTGSTGATSLAATDVTVAGTSLPRGILPGGYIEKTTNSSGVSTTTVTGVAGLAATVTVAANRRIRVSFYGSILSTVAGDRGSVVLRDNTGGTNIGVAQSAALPTANSSVGNSVSAVVMPAAGTITYSVAIQRVSGTGAVSTYGATGFPAQLIVEDIGPAV